MPTMMSISQLLRSLFSWTLILVALVGGFAGGPDAIGQTIEPVEVEWYLFTRPRIETPVPVEHEMSVKSQSRVLKPEEFASLSSIGKATVIEDLLDMLGEQELYGKTDGPKASVLPEGFVAPLLAEAESHPLHSARRRRLISLLLHSPASSKAKEIFELSREDPLLRDTVEAKLIDWQSDAAADDWRESIGDPAAPIGRVILALRGLAAIGDSSAVDAAEGWLAFNQPGPVRLAAARLLAVAQPNGNVERAKKHLRIAQRNDSPTDAAIAARLLSGDTSDAGRETLVDVLDAGFDGTDEIAFTAIRQHHPDTAYELAFQWIERGSDQVRRQSLDLLKTSSDTKNLAAIFGALDDAHPENRVKARRILLKAAEEPETRSLVLRAFRKMLNSSSWGAIEQGILGLVALEDKASVRQFAQLIRHEVPSVNVTAAWALKEMAEEPVVVDQVSKFVDERWQRATLEDVDRVEYLSEDETKLYSQLIEMLGKHRHQESTQFLKTVVNPNISPGVLVRGSAVWSLGMIHAEDPPADLIRMFHDRINSLETNNADHPLMAFVSLISLGRMGDRTAIPLFEKHMGGVDNRVNLGAAASWAMEQLQSGESTQ